MGDFFKVDKFTQQLIEQLPNNDLSLGAKLIQFNKSKGYNFSNKSDYHASTVEDLSKKILEGKDVNIVCRERALLFATIFRNIEKKNILVRRGFIKLGKNHWGDHIVNQFGENIIDLNLIEKDHNADMVRNKKTFKFSWEVWDEVKDNTLYFEFGKAKFHFTNPYTKNNRIPDISAVILALLWDALALQDIIPMLGTNIVVGKNEIFDYRHFFKLTQFNSDEAMEYFNRHRLVLEAVANAIKFFDNGYSESGALELKNLNIYYL